MDSLPEEEARLVRSGRHHAHAVKVGNGHRKARRKKRRLIVVQGVTVNGHPYGFVG